MGSVPRMVKGRLGNVFFERIMEDEDLVDAIKKRAEKKQCESRVFHSHWKSKKNRSRLP